MRNVGGPLDYQRLARLFRPDDREQLAREARRLAGQGLKPRDIGAALQVEPAEVAGWLQEEAA